MPAMTSRPPRLTRIHPPTLAPLPEPALGGTVGAGAGAAVASFRAVWSSAISITPKCGRLLSGHRIVPIVAPGDLTVIDPTPIQSRLLAALRPIVAGISRFDHQNFQPVRGVRYALGVGIPLFLGVATGHTIEGIAVAGGSSLIGLTDSGIPYRGRLRAMLIASFAAAIS